MRAGSVMVWKAGPTERERRGQKVEQQQQADEVEEEEEELGSGASNQLPLHTHTHMHKQSFTFTHPGQSEVFLAQRRTLTRQDDVTRAEQTQTIQQVDQLVDSAFPAPPLVHHPGGPILLLLSQLHGGLIAQDL